MIFTHDAETGLNSIVGILGLIEFDTDLLPFHFLVLLRSSYSLIYIASRISQVFNVSGGRELGEYSSSYWELFLAIKEPSPELIVINDTIFISIQWQEGTLQIYWEEVVAQIIETRLKLLSIDSTWLIFIIFVKLRSNFTFFVYFDCFFCLR